MRLLVCPYIVRTSSSSISLGRRPSSTIPSRRSMSCPTGVPAAYYRFKFTSLKGLRRRYTSMHVCILHLIYAGGHTTSRELNCCCCALLCSAKESPFTSLCWLPNCCHPFTSHPWSLCFQGEWGWRYRGRTAPQEMGTVQGGGIQEEMELTLDLDEVSERHY